ncbi:hypothetical protein F4703DRAFT_1798092 [Phycomyces blakesleeanus]
MGNKTEGKETRKDKRKCLCGITFCLIFAIFVPISKQRLPAFEWFLFYFILARKFDFAIPKNKRQKNQKKNTDFYKIWETKKLKRDRKKKEEEEYVIQQKNEKFSGISDIGKVESCFRTEPRDILKKKYRVTISQDSIST